MTEKNKEALAINVVEMDGESLEDIAIERRLLIDLLDDINDEAEVLCTLEKIKNCNDRIRMFL